VPTPTPQQSGSPAYLGLFNAYNQTSTWAWEGEGSTTNFTCSGATTSGGFALWESWGFNGTSNTTNRIYWVDGLGKNIAHLRFDLSGDGQTSGTSGGSISTCMDGTGGVSTGANQYNCPNGGPLDRGQVNTSAWGANNLGGVVNSTPPAYTWSLANQVGLTGNAQNTVQWYHERWFSMMGWHFAQQVIAVFSGTVGFTNNSSGHTIPNNVSWTVCALSMMM
jgi:hypothetical protein